MTTKELHRLKRRELLQLLLAQSEEAEEIRKKLEETSAELELTASNYERLRKRLDQKDAQIAELRATIEEERTKRRIELDDAGNIAEAALRLNGVFEAAQAAAEQYLENMRIRQAAMDAREAELRTREAELRAGEETADAHTEDSPEAADNGEAPD